MSYDRTMECEIHGFTQTLPVWEATLTASRYHASTADTTQFRASLICAMAMIFSHAQRKLSPSHKSHLFSTCDATLRRINMQIKRSKTESSSINICTGSHGRARSSISSRHIVCLAASKMLSLGKGWRLRAHHDRDTYIAYHGAWAYIALQQWGMRVQEYGGLASVIYAHFVTLKKHSNCCKKNRRRI